MPTLRIMSAYHAQKVLHAEELACARSELEEFRANLVVRFGEQVAAAVQQQVSWNEDMVFGRVEVLRLTDDGEDAVKTLRMLTRKVREVLRHIRTPNCWFRESSVPTSVLAPAGLSWKSVEERCVADGRLRLVGALWLLSVLNTTEAVMPSDAEVWEWAASGCSPCHLPHEWRRILQNRRRRLVMLLETAAELEEDLKYDE